MKKLIILIVFITHYTFAQSVTIAPSVANQALEIKKLGVGIDHRDKNNMIGVGTYVDNSVAFFQSHTNHPLNFSTYYSSGQLTLLTNGNVGIGSLNPSYKLHVIGNAYVSGNLESDGLISVGSLNIGGGSIINKYFKVFLSGETIPAITAKTCSTKNFSVSGVTSADVIMGHIVGAYSGNTAIATVRPLTNQVEVKFCNNANTNSSIQTVDLKFTIIK